MVTQLLTEAQTTGAGEYPFKDLCAGNDALNVMYFQGDKVTTYLE